MTHFYKLIRWTGRSETFQEFNFLYFIGMLFILKFLDHGSLKNEIFRISAIQSYFHCE